MTGDDGENLERYARCFKAPNLDSLSMRTSTITSAFLKSVIPSVMPTPEEIKQALEILKIVPEHLTCAYCGSSADTWDHFRACVRDKKLTGYITEIRNLVPSCAKCNSSKGGKNWREWMEGKAKNSPKTRKISDLDERVDRLLNFEAWGNVSNLPLEQMAGELWTEYEVEREKLVKEMLQIHEKHSLKVRMKIEDSLNKSCSVTATPPIDGSPAVPPSLAEGL